MGTTYIGDMDLTNMYFAPMVNENGRKTVEIATHTPTSVNKFKFKVNLAPGAEEPLRAVFPLDSVRDDGNPQRRSQAIMITEPKACQKLKELDDIIVNHAFANSKEYFKEKLSLEGVRARYKKLAMHTGDDDSQVTIKVKVKCDGAKFPTVLHLRDAVTNALTQEGGKVEHLEERGALLVPIVSGYALWFMAGSFGLCLQAEEMIVTPGEMVGDWMAKFSPVASSVKPEQSSSDEKLPPSAAAANYELLNNGKRPLEKTADTVVPKKKPA